MVEGTRALLAVLAAMSVVVVAGYVVVFLAAATWTVVRRDRRDPLELERALDAISRRAPSVAADHGRQAGGPVR